MLSTTEILAAASDAVNAAPNSMDEYWNKEGQSAKIFREALEFLEVDVTAERQRLFEIALCIGYELGKTDNALQTYTSTN